MPVDEPSWWYRPAPTLAARLLRPAGALYAWAGARRFATAEPYRAGHPVICVGNLTAGGTGKTPIALHIARRLIAHGAEPVFLTRGHGGRIHGPHLVTGSDDATAVGDEPLLLARAGPTMVARDRAAGARAIETRLAAARTAIVMDDGLQNPGLAKDLAIAVVDAVRGIGNGEVMPAGPLRAPLASQLPRIDAIIVNHPPPPFDATASAEDTVAESPVADWFRARFHGPVLMAHVGPAGDHDWLRDGPVVAFAGIANPARFVTLLRHLEADLAAFRSFRDHHAFTDADARDLIALADRRGAQLVTTEKDHVRLAGATGARGELHARTRPVGIAITFEARNAGRLDGLLRGALGASSHRRHD